MSEAPAATLPSRPPPSRRAFVHVGAPKTGSTFLQGLFWRNRAALLGDGLEVLGENQGQHYRAGKDVRGMPFDPNDPGMDWTGAWADLAERAVTSASASVLLTDEHLAALTADQCRHVAASLAPRELHVVYVMRDLAGLLPSEWQEYVKHGSTLTFAAWARRVLEKPRSAEARWFWSVHDPVSVVSRWREATDASRVHVVTMPPRESPSDELWRRFAGVVGVDPGVAHTLEAPGNTSLGLAAAEVLRRVNAALPDDMPRWHRTGVVRDVLANQVLHPLGGAGRPSLPDDLAQLVEQRARHAREQLPGTGCVIVGRLPEPRGAVLGDPPPDDGEVAEVAVAALAAMATRIGRMRDNRRAAELRIRDQHARQLTEVEQSFWDQHPLTRRAQRAKERVVAAEADHAVLARTMDGYRWARRVVRRDPTT